MNVHETLTDIQKRPVVVMRHRGNENWRIVKVFCCNHKGLEARTGRPKNIRAGLRLFKKFLWPGQKFFMGYFGVGPEISVP